MAALRHGCLSALSPLSPLLVVNVRPFGRAEPVPDAALGFHLQEQGVDAVHHPAGLDPLRRLHIPQTKRKVDRATTRFVGELDTVLFALAHGVTMFK